MLSCCKGDSDGSGDEGSLFVGKKIYKSAANGVASVIERERKRMRKLAQLDKELQKQKYYEQQNSYKDGKQNNGQEKKYEGIYIKSSKCGDQKSLLEKKSSNVDSGYDEDNNKLKTHPKTPTAAELSRSVSLANFNQTDNAGKQHSIKRQGSDFHLSRNASASELRHLDIQIKKGTPKSTHKAVRKYGDGSHLANNDRDSAYATLPKKSSSEAISRCVSNPAIQMIKQKEDREALIRKTSKTELKQSSRSPQKLIGEGVNVLEMKVLSQRVRRSRNSHGNRSSVSSTSSSSSFMDESAASTPRTSATFQMGELSEERFEEGKGHIKETEKCKVRKESGSKKGALRRCKSDFANQPEDHRCSKSSEEDDIFEAEGNEVELRKHKNLDKRRTKSDVHAVLRASNVSARSIDSFSNVAEFRTGQASGSNTSNGACSSRRRCKKSLQSFDEDRPHSELNSWSIDLRMKLQKATSQERLSWSPSEIGTDNNYKHVTKSLHDVKPDEESQPKRKDSGTISDVVNKGMHRVDSSKTLKMVLRTMDVGLKSAALKEQTPSGVEVHEDERKKWKLVSENIEECDDTALHQEIMGYREDEQGTPLSKRRTRFLVHDSNKDCNEIKSSKYTRKTSAQERRCDDGTADRNILKASASLPQFEIELKERLQLRKSEVDKNANIAQSKQVVKNERNEHEEKQVRRKSSGEKIKNVFDNKDEICQLNHDQKKTKSTASRSPTRKLSKNEEELHNNKQTKGLNHIEEEINVDCKRKSSLQNKIGGVSRKNSNETAKPSEVRVNENRVHKNKNDTQTKNRESIKLNQKNKKQSENKTSQNNQPQLENKGRRRAQRARKPARRSQSEKPKAHYRSVQAINSEAANRSVKSPKQDSNSNRAHQLGVLRRSMSLGAIHLEHVKQECNAEARVRNEGRRGMKVQMSEQMITNPNSNRTYSKGRLLGKGGFAKCVEMFDIENGESVAAKIVTSGRMLKYRMRDRIQQEAELHRQLNHAHVVKFIDYFEHQGSAFLLLENCTNQTLVHMLFNRRQLTEPEVRYYMWQLVEGCQYLHGSSIIHRDLKLANMLLASDMTLKIADFGLATRIQFVGEKKRSVCGTPNYIAPEVLQKVGHSFEADIWSIGCIMYTLLCGQPPFDSISVRETYQRILECKYSVPANIPKPARSLIERLLMKDPTKRATLSEILADEFMVGGYRPTCLPSSACWVEPKFSLWQQLQKQSHLENNGNSGKNAMYRQLLEAAAHLLWSSGVNGNRTHSPETKRKLGRHSSTTTTTTTATTSSGFSSQNYSNRKDLRLRLSAGWQQWLGRGKREELGSVGGVSKAELDLIDRIEDNAQKSLSLSLHSVKIVPQTGKESARYSAERLYVLLDSCLTDTLNIPQDKNRRHRLPEPLHKQDVPEFCWVVKWVDYTNMYGFGFQLSDHRVGILFNDSTRMLLDPDTKTVFVKEPSKSRHLGNNRHSNSSTQSPSLENEDDLIKRYHKRLTLVLYFAQYMKKYLVSSTGGSGKQSTGEMSGEMKQTTHRGMRGENDCGPVFLLKWHRDERTIVLLLSDGTLQVNYFADHTKLILTPSGKDYLVTLMSRSSAGLETVTYHLSDVVFASAQLQSTSAEYVINTEHSQSGERIKIILKHLHVALEMFSEIIKKSNRH